MSVRFTGLLAVSAVLLAGSTAVSGIYYDEVMSDTPEAYWRLNETTGTNMAADSSGNGHGFTYGSAISRTGTAPDVGPRRTAFAGFELDNNAPTLDGTYDDAGLVGTPTGVLPGSPGGTNNDYTVEMWVRPGEDNNDHSDYLCHRCDSGASVGTGDYLILHSAGTGHSYEYLKIYNGDTVINGTTILAEGGWYHVCMIREGDYLSVCLNGQEEIASTYLPPSGVWTNGTWAFGGRNDSAGQTFSGNIDEIAIYAGALDADTILAHYSAALPEPSTLALAAGGVLLLLGLCRRKGR